MLPHSLSALCSLEQQQLVAASCHGLLGPMQLCGPLIPAVTTCLLFDLQSDGRLTLTDLSDHPADVSGGYLVEFEHGQNTDGVQNINLTRWLGASVHRPATLLIRVCWCTCWKFLCAGQTCNGTSMSPASQKSLQQQCLTSMGGCWAQYERSHWHATTAKQMLVSAGTSTTLRGLCTAQTLTA